MVGSVLFDSNVVSAQWLFKWKADVQGMVATATARLIT